MTTDKPKTAAQNAAEALRRADEAHTISAENNRLLKELHAGLMQPLPGYNKSFVERATEVVVEAEAGKIVGEKLVWYAKVLAAVAAIGAGLTALVTWGNPR
jgi:hypothetical protein